MTTTYGNLHGDDFRMEGAWDPQFFVRTDPKAEPAVPALAWLETVPDAVEAEIMATIDAVARVLHRNSGVACGTKQCTAT